jgi:hypothetical protein
MTTKPIPQPVCHGNGGNYVYVTSGPTGHMVIAVRDTELTAAEIQSDDDWAMPGFEREDCWDRIALQPEDAIELARVLVDCAKWVLNREGIRRREIRRGDDE